MSLRFEFIVMAEKYVKIFSRTWDLGYLTSDRVRIENVLRCRSKLFHS